MHAYWDRMVIYSCVSGTEEEKDEDVVHFVTTLYIHSQLSFRCIISRCSSLSDACWRLALDSCKRLSHRQGGREETGREGVSEGDREGVRE